MLLTSSSSIQIAYLSDKFMQRGLFVAVNALVTFTGLMLMAYLSPTQSGARYFGGTFSSFRRFDMAILLTVTFRRLINSFLGHYGMSSQYSWSFSSPSEQRLTTF